mgnify:CR=1 FL=1
MKKKLNILGVIPARGGSKGIKKKNITKILGKPLIYYTIKAAKKSKIISDLIVSTDSKEIAKISKKITKMSQDLVYCWDFTPQNQSKILQLFSTKFFWGRSTRLLNKISSSNVRQMSLWSWFESWRRP